MTEGDFALVRCKGGLKGIVAHEEVLGSVERV